MRIVAYLVEDGEHVLVAGIGEDDDGEGAEGWDRAGPADDADGCVVGFGGVTGAEVVDDKYDEVAD